MDFIANSEAQNKEMRISIGIESIQELLQAIPSKLLLQTPSYNDGLSEFEGMRLIEALAAQNRFSQFENYLGAGAYEHHVPALVGAICSKSEFLTSYTPYQPEASQGILQAIFEFQSAICALTDMDVANASLYDGASACAEAALMALRHRKESTKLFIAHTLHPHYRAVVEHYVSSHGVKIATIPFLSDGLIDLENLKDLLDDKTAAILIQSPNFFGALEDVRAAIEIARAKGALSILCANPLAYGLFESAGELGADIAVGDGQPFGIPLQYGGPYVGYMACKKELLRQLPGRIAGETLDSEGRRGYVLTLQAREQHIRREKATSNICTNQALASLACLVAMLWYGKEGVRELALKNYQRAAYLKNGLQALAIDKSPCFNEFRIQFNHPSQQVLNHFRSYGIEPGLTLERFYPQLKRQFLVAVTETKSKEQLDRYIACAQKLQ